MHRITSLYPQYQRNQDRRQQNIPVAIDRRSGNDRRSSDRVMLDKQLTRDIFEVKSKVAQLEKMAPKLFETGMTKQSATFGALSNNGQNQVINAAKEMASIQKQEEKLKDKASTTFQIGVLAAALTGAFAISYMGSAAAVIAIGTTIYIGGKILKAMLSKEIKNDTKK